MSKRCIQRRIMDYSSMSKFEYLSFHYFILAVSLYLITKIGPFIWSFVTEPIYYWKLALIMLAASIPGIILSYDRFRNSFGVVFDTIVEIATVNFFISWKYSKIACIISVFCVVGTLIFTTLLFYFYNCKKCKPIFRFLLCSCKFTLLKSRRVIAAILLLSLLIIPIVCKCIHGKGINDGISSYLDDNTTKNQPLEITQVYGEEYGLIYNIERIKYIAFENLWNELDISERQKTMQAVIECDLQYLGVSREIDISFEQNVRESVYGYYSPGEKLIVINNEALKNMTADEALVTALHESRHFYQYCLCEAVAKLSSQERNLLCFQGIDEWYMNFIDYVDGQEDLYKYYYQEIEIDARNYSETQAEIYKNLIINYSDILSEIDYSDEANNGHRN